MLLYVYVYAGDGLYCVLVFNKIWRGYHWRGI
jgi:hypothetical protein